MKKRFLKRGLAVTCAAVLAVSGINTVFADYSEKNKIFSAEFDGKDDISMWAQFDQGGTYVNSGENIHKDIKGENTGILDVNRNLVGYGRWGVYFEKPYNTEGMTDIVIKTRFKSDFAGTALNQNLLKVKSMRSDNSLQSMLDVNTSGSYLKYNSSAVTDYEIKENTWYEITVKLDFVAQKGYVTVTDDAGKSKEMSGGFINGSAFTYSGIHDVSTMRTTDDDKYYIDYFRMWDDALVIDSTSVADKAEGVSADTAYSVTFSSDIDGTTLSGITVTDEAENKVPVEITPNGKNADLYFPAGLKYDEKYTVKIPNTVKDAGGAGIKQAEEFTFTTEPEPFKAVAKDVELLGNKATAKIEAINKTTAAKDIYVITIVYSKGAVARMTNQKITIPVGTDTTISAEVLDISGIESPTAKAYVWSGIGG